MQAISALPRSMAAALRAVWPLVLVRRLQLEAPEEDSAHVRLTMDLRSDYATLRLAATLRPDPDARDVQLLQLCGEGLTDGGCSRAMTLRARYGAALSSTEGSAAALATWSALLRQLRLSPAPHILLTSQLRHEEAVPGEALWGPWHAQLTPHQLRLFPASAGLPRAGTAPALTLALDVTAPAASNLHLPPADRPPLLALTSTAPADGPTANAALLGPLLASIRSELDAALAPLRTLAPLSPAAAAAAAATAAATATAAPPSSSNQSQGAAGQKRRRSHAAATEDEAGVAAEGTAEAARELQPVQASSRNLLLLVDEEEEEEAAAMAAGGAGEETAAAMEVALLADGPRAKAEQQCAFPGE